MINGFLQAFYGIFDSHFTIHMASFGQHLKQLRKVKGISQGQLAELMELDPSHVSRYERDQTQPSISVAIKFAKVLGVSLNELAYGSEEQFIQDSIEDSELLELFKQLKGLPKDDLQAVKRMLTAFVFQKDVKQKLGA